MSEFNGYMGGAPGQGMPAAGTNQSGNFGAGAAPQTQANIINPNPSAAMSTPTSASGSITKYYNPAMQQGQGPAPMSSPAYSQGPQQHYQPQVTPTMMHQQQAQMHYQQYPQQHLASPTYQQPYEQQNLQSPTYSQAPQPNVMLQSQPIAQHQQPPHVVQQQQQPTHVVHQQQHQTQPAPPVGSYSSRSAHAHAAMGAMPPPRVQMTQDAQHGAMPAMASPSMGMKPNKYDDSPAVQAQQNRLLTDCTRKVQENAYYMKQAMDKNDLSSVLDRAAQMVGELADSSSGQLTPKNYYELQMRALDDMPNLEEYFLSLTSAENSQFTMLDVYAHVHYCPRVLPRLYLQISAGSALVRSKEESPVWVLNDLIECVKCVQNPLRGLFLRNFLLQATRDKLPDGDQVKEAYDFVLANFIEMNKLWVRIQHLPGEGKSKEQRKRREKERNELRILVGTNLVRLSQLEAVTSKIYGEIILPVILEQITVCGDPLAQAYLIDCIIQVFPDEYHIETLPILLAVCPKLRDKVNIKTIMQSLMDRLANYYADEELLDEADTNEVKKSVFRDSFPMFQDCVKNVFNARGPKLSPKEVIRLQMALLNFSLKCYPGNMEQVSLSLADCARFIRQAANAPAVANQTPLLEDADIHLDEASVSELEKMLSIPLDSLAMKVLELSDYSDLLQFLPWENRRDVGMTMLRAIDASGDAPSHVKELEELFSILLPVIRNNQPGNNNKFVDSDRAHEMQEENSLVSKLIHLISHDNHDNAYEMLSVARSHISEGDSDRIDTMLVPVVFSALRLAQKLNVQEKPVETEVCEEAPEVTPPEEKGDLNESEEADPGQGEEIGTSDSQADEPDTAGKEEADMVADAGDVTEEMEDLREEDKEEASGQVGKASILCSRKIFLFIQTTIAMIAKGNPELCIKLYLQAAMAADSMASRGEVEGFEQILYELLSQAFTLHNQETFDAQTQQRCIVQMVGTLLALKSLKTVEYESFIAKTAQFAAKQTKKHDQCHMVAFCSRLFYAVGEEGEMQYQNPQRTLECLQRALKLADASTMSSANNVFLFVELLEDYLHFYEANNPVITDTYVSGLVALIKEHLDGFPDSDTGIVNGAKSHFARVVCYINQRKADQETAEKFSRIVL